jgi:predicted site-specific integrase-resolvase
MLQEQQECSWNNNQFVFDSIHLKHCMSNSEFVTGAKIKQLYGVSTQSLHRWETDGKITAVRTPGGRRLYRMSEVLSLFEPTRIQQPQKKKVCYARVSSSKQEKDLERQIEQLEEACPDQEIFQDIGSGINFKRKSFQRLLDEIYSGNIEQVTITHKDRLCRFASDLLDWIFSKTSTSNINSVPFANFCLELVVLGSDEKGNNEQEELGEDLITIANFFVARHNGLRAGENRRRRKREQEENNEQEAENEKRRKQETKDQDREGSSSESDQDSSLSD